VLKLADKSITVRIPEELHQKLRIKLAEDNKTFQDWAKDKIIEYVDSE